MHRNRKKRVITKNICVSDDVLDKITEDVMNITYAKGGNYSYDVVQCFAETYVEEEFIKNLVIALENEAKSKSARGILADLEHLNTDVLM